MMPLLPPLQEAVCQCSRWGHACASFHPKKACAFSHSPSNTEPEACPAVLQLTELPPRHMYVGKTHLTVNDIRSFNNLQRLDYELHQNDCRYVYPCALYVAQGFPVGA